MWDFRVKSTTLRPTIPHKNTLAEKGCLRMHTTKHALKREGICLRNLPPRWKSGEIRKSHNCGILHILEVPQKYFRVGTYHTYKHQNDLLCTIHACTGTNTANLTEPTACLNRSITSILPRMWQDINRSLGPHRRLQLATVYKGILWSQDHRTPPFEANRRLFIEWRWWQNYIAWCILTYGTYQMGRVSLRAQCTKQQVIFHCAYACPKINNDMLWNKVTGSLAILSMIHLASKILCQLGCHWLCDSAVNLLLCTACERRRQGLSIICFAAW